MSKWLSFVAMAVLAVGITGCASNNQLQMKVERALSTAQAAQEAAMQAQEAANAAQQTANRALSVAKEAKACCQANSQRIERMFEASMRK